MDGHLLATERLSIIPTTATSPPPVKLLANGVKMFIGLLGWMEFGDCEVQSRVKYFIYFITILRPQETGTLSLSIPTRHR